MFWIFDFDISFPPFIFVFFWCFISMYVLLAFIRTSSSLNMFAEYWCIYLLWGFIEYLCPFSRSRDLPPTYSLWPVEHLESFGFVGYPLSNFTLVPQGPCPRIHHIINTPKYRFFRNENDISFSTGKEELFEGLTVVWSSMQCRVIFYALLCFALLV